jgi:type II secretory pathway component PulJ
MPPVIVWAAGAIGALMVARLLARASRRVNADLERIRRERAVERPLQTLERDPATGEYRPPRS